MLVRCYGCGWALAELILPLAGKIYDLCPSCYKRHMDGNRMIRDAAKRERASRGDVFGSIRTHEYQNVRTIKKGAAK